MSICLPFKQVISPLCFMTLYCSLALSGCVIEKGIESEDESSAGTEGGSIVVAGGEIMGGESMGGGIGGEIGGETVVIDMSPPRDVRPPDDCDVAQCPPGFSLLDCECIPDPDNPPPCECDSVYDPVCGIDGYTYGNECEIDCYGREIAYFGECEPRFDCIEPNPEVEYISDSPEECELIDFDCPPNAEYYFDECGCGCYVYDCEAECANAPEFPVCTPDGQRYANECLASCSGQFNYRPCESQCECPDIYDPQCGLDGATYNNACLRECVGVPLNYEGTCQSDWFCDDPAIQNDCNLLCNELSSCFTDQCSDDELQSVQEACGRMCQEWGPQELCAFGSCFELPFLLQDFQDVYLECLDIEQLCPDEFNGAEYISYDPEACRLIGDIDCGDGESFSGPCGCGCLNTSCLNENEARYISRSPEACSRITFDCPQGSQAFNDECGCGCSF